MLLHKHVGTKSRAAAALLSLGMLMGEEYEGTTSTALCLREQSVVELFGAEHLIREEEDLCCISAPIFGGKRRMLGVLTIALPLELYHLHTSGMVLMAAKDISDQHHLHDLLSDQEAILEQVDTGIVVLDKNGGIKAANCTGRSMLHISPPPAPLGNINDVLGSAESLLMMIQSRKNIRDRECFFNLTDGGSLQCMLSAAPIPNDKGMVLFLHEASKAQRLAAHSVGAKAIYTFSSIIGESPSLQKAIELSKVASHSNITTLILGESGTGKELFAHAIHNASARKNAPFVVVNCGALPRDLIQSELFGYDPGAFTGAQKQGKPGKFELAEGGTIFLDEIGDMPLEAQINLLRVIQNKEVSRIGGKFSRPIDVRIIAATNKRLQQSVRDGSFREDLFYRLSVLTIDVPPLRERQQDVMLLAESFLRAGVQAIHKPCRGFSAEVAEIFSRYPWPGNVRELENIVERSLNIARGDTIEREDEDLGGRNRWQAAPAPGNIPAAVLPGRDTGRGGTLQSREVEILLDVLKANGGNMRKTAQELGIARSALYAKLHRMGIDIAALRSGR